MTLVPLLLFGLVTTTVVVSASRTKRKHGHPSSRSVRVLNQSGATLDLFWIHPETNVLAESHTSGDGIMYGGETGISSYIGHTFEVQEIGKCLHKLCRKAYFTVNQNEDQWVTIDKEFFITVEDSTTRANDRAQKALGNCRLVGMEEDEDKTRVSTPQQRMDAVAACLLQSIEREMNTTDDEIAFQASVRKDLGQRLKEYTCNEIPEVKVNTTASIHNATWDKHNVKILFESDYSSVRIVEEFLTQVQCDNLLTKSGLTTFSNGEGVQPSQLDPSIVQHLTHMMTNTMGLPSNHYQSNKLDLHVWIDDGKSEQEQCEMKTDGSCLENSSADFPKLKNSTVSASVITTDESKVQARLLMICRSKDATGGLIFFPKAGVRILPVSRDAVLIIHQDLNSGKHETDPFLDEHMICPLQHGMATTLEEVFPNQ